MTGNEINALPPKEVNKEVVKRLMGGVKADYVNSFDAAWKIVDKMRVFDNGKERHETFGPETVWHYFETALYYQLADENLEARERKGFSVTTSHVMRKLTPLVICRAALNTCWVFGGDYKYPKTEEAIALLQKKG